MIAYTKYKVIQIDSRPGTKYEKYDILLGATCFDMYLDVGKYGMLMIENGDAHDSIILPVILSVVESEDCGIILIHTKDCEIKLRKEDSDGN